MKIKRIRWNFRIQRRDLTQSLNVVDDEIILRMDDLKPEIVKQARQELTEEDTRIRREDERKHNHRQLIESMNTRPFWHYCEVCVK